MTDRIADCPYRLPHRHDRDAFRGEYRIAREHAWDGWWNLLIELHENPDARRTFVNEHDQQPHHASIEDFSVQMGRFLTRPTTDDRAVPRRLQASHRRHFMTAGDVVDRLIECFNDLEPDAPAARTEHPNEITTLLFGSPVTVRVGVETTDTGLILDLTPTGEDDHVLGGIGVALLSEIAVHQLLLPVAPSRWQIPCLHHAAGHPGTDTGNIGSEPG